MKKYSLVESWRGGKPINQIDFDDLKEFYEIPKIKSIIEDPNFTKLSIQTSYVCSYATDNYNIYQLIAEYYDGYMVEDIGNLINNPITFLNEGFPDGATMSPANCGAFNPIIEFNLPVFNDVLYNVMSRGAFFAIRGSIAHPTNYNINQIKNMVKIFSEEFDNEKRNKEI